MEIKISIPSKSSKSVPNPSKNNSKIRTTIKVKLKYLVTSFKIIRGRLGKNYKKCFKERF